MKELFEIFWCESQKGDLDFKTQNLAKKLKEKLPRIDFDQVKTGSLKLQQGKHSL